MANEYVAGPASTAITAATAPTRRHVREGASSAISPTAAATGMAIRIAGAQSPSSETASSAEPAIPAISTAIPMVEWAGQPISATSPAADSAATAGISALT